MWIPNNHINYFYDYNHEWYNTYDKNNTYCYSSERYRNLRCPVDGSRDILYVAEEKTIKG